jgi:predicted NAD/FAD-binding protein
MRIAIIGTGISGNVCSYLLNKAHDITVYEAADHIGGHTHTHDIDSGDKRYAVDSGFIVFNEKTYPNFLKLLKKLGVEWQASDMSFSVKAEDIGLEYKPTNLDSLFAQRRNLLKPPFYRMLLDILKFRKDLMPIVGSRDYSLNLGQFMKNKGYGDWLLPYFVIPLGSAIWSAAPDVFLDFPIALYASFYANHGFLNVRDQPQWLVIKGGAGNMFARSQGISKTKSVCHARSAPCGAKKISLR